MFRLWKSRIEDELNNTVKNIIKTLLFKPGLRDYRIRGGKLAGLQFRFDLRHDTQAWRGVYEQPLQEWLSTYVKPGDTCLDIGGADGYFALLMAKLSGKQGHIHSFEPSSKVEHIQYNFALNQSLPLAPLTCYEAFVGKEQNSHTKTMSIDNLVDTGIIDQVNIVKIDVDGGEVDVLSGMAETLKKFHPHLFIETHSVELQRQVEAIVAEYGYSMRLELPARHEFRPMVEFNAFYFSQETEK